MLLHSVFRGGSFNTFRQTTTTSRLLFFCSPFALVRCCFITIHPRVHASGCHTYEYVCMTPSIYSPVLHVRVVGALHALLAILLRLARTASLMARSRNKRHGRIVISWLVSRFERIACTSIRRLLGRKMPFPLGPRMLSLGAISMFQQQRKKKTAELFDHPSRLSQSFSGVFEQVLVCVAAPSVTLPRHQHRE